MSYRPPSITSRRAGSSLAVPKPLAILLLALVALLLVPSAAQAEGEAVQTRLQAEDEAGERQPVVGVEFTVSTDEVEIGTAATDDDGVFRLDVPGPGEYTVTINPDTLPPGIVLRNVDRIANVARVEPGGVGNTIFAVQRAELSADDESGGSSGSGISLRRVLQLSVDGLKLGLFLGMAAIGLSLIFGTTGLVNFAHSEMIAFGYFTAYLFNFYGFAGFLGFMASWPAPFGAGVNLIFAILLAVVAGGLFGWVLDTFLFAPLRRRGVSLIAQLVVTIGLSILLRYLFFLAFGGAPRFFRDYTAQRAREYWLVQIEDSDLIMMIITVVVLVGVGLLLSRTRIGKAMRAVADNRDLAESSGIDVERVIRFVWVAGAALAALGGAFLGLSETVNFLLGFRMLLLIFAGVTLGGLGTTYGALVGCLIIGMGIQLSTLFIPIELKNAGALLVLILVLMVRPQGILGRAERIG